MSVLNDTVSERRESNVRSYSRIFPAVFDRAKGAYLYDIDGNPFIDFFAGAGSLNYGHNPDFIKHRLIEHLASDRMVQGLDLDSVIKRDFLEAFEEVVLAPRGLDYKIQLCAPSGATAVEAAIKLARRVTGRTAVAAFSGSFHGMSTGSLAVTSEQVCRTAAGAPLPAATFFPFEDGPYRWSDSVNYITYLLENSHSGVDLPAALILETIQAEGGVYVASPEWLRQIRSLCDRFGVVMIVDDVQVGCGRTGDFFSFEAAGIKPDIVCLSKSLSGYGLPMAITLIKRELDLWNPGEHTGTFRGSQLSLLAATVALDLWRCATFVGELKTRSQYLDARVRGIAAGLGHLASRGRGLIWAIDFTDAGGADSARRAALAAFRLGLLVERCGPDGVALKLLPPILIDDDAIDKGCDLLSEACRLAQ